MQIATAVLPLPTANNPDRAGASIRAPCRAVPVPGWSCSLAGSHRRLIAFFPQGRNYSRLPHKTEQARALFSRLPPAISLHQLHAALLILFLLRRLRWTAAASSPRSSWIRCACTWPPTPARSSPRRSASSTSSTSPPRSASPLPLSNLP